MTPAPTETIFTTLRRISEEEKLPLLIVGGNAINAYGYQRTTFDIDVAIPDTDKDKWQNIIKAIGYQMYFGTEFFLRFKGKENTPLFPLDLMLLSSATFLKLTQSSKWKPMGNVSLPVPDPLHLIALKLHAMQQPARALEGKDLPDILGLIRLTEIDVQSEAFQTILQKYADPATRAAILQSLQPRS
jgi:hypothetical protein